MSEALGGRYSAFVCHEPFYFVDDLSCRASQGDGQLDKSGDRWLIDAPFHQADVVTLQCCLKGQLLLGESCLDTPSAQNLSES
ncbi:hypothetical protein HW05_12195 [Pseudomonas aeruginosa]|nr:hypothetical protein HW05_12195 [Pseudomonas aeruginosa]